MWTEAVYCDGTAFCSSMIEHPDWCTDYGEYSDSAALNCLVSCWTCPAECADVGTWTDAAYGDGTASCSSMIEHPDWCTDYGAYFDSAALNCLVFCVACPPECADNGMWTDAAV